MGTLWSKLPMSGVVTPVHPVASSLVFGMEQRGLFGMDLGTERSQCREKSVPLESELLL